MRKEWNAETGEFDIYPDEITPLEGSEEPEVEMSKEERIEAIREVVGRKLGHSGKGMTGAERQAKWRENHPGQYAKRRKYHLDYMREYRARVKP